MTLKAIVFDVGGVLIRTEDHTARHQLEEKYHLQKGEVHDLVFNSSVADEASIGLKPVEAIWAFAAETLNLDAEALIDFQEKFWEGDRLDHVLLDYLSSLQPKYKTALLSNAWSNMRQILDTRYDIREGETVDFILISAELGTMKPDPEVYEILKDRLDIDFPEILFVDDFIENIQAAKKLGINTIHYQPGMDLINQIESQL
jgi:putative hydrolase of the HAD superfamily